jgi:molecular chaperone GrpE
MEETPTVDEQEAIAEQADPKDQEIDRLRAEVEGLRDQLLRAMAEAQNIQRRLRAQMEEDRKFAAQALVQELLPVMDNFERAIRLAEQEASLEKLLEGVKATDRLLRKALESANVARIEAVGRPYDPERHEALAVLETEEHPEDHVTEEIEPGYTLHGRVIRPARVRVAKRP